MLINHSIRLLIADDHDLVRFSLRVYFSTWEDIKVVGEAENGQLAVAQFQILKPDVVLMDLNMPVMDGVGATRAIVQQFPPALILILTSGMEPNQQIAAQQAGAVGCISKFVPGGDIVNAVRKVYQHN